MANSTVTAVAVAVSVSVISDQQSVDVSVSGQLQSSGKKETCRLQIHQNNEVGEVEKSEMREVEKKSTAVNE